MGLSVCGDTYYHLADELVTAALEEDHAELIDDNPNQANIQTGIDLYRAKEARRAAVKALREYLAEEDLQQEAA